MKLVKGGELGVVLIANADQSTFSSSLESENPWVKIDVFGSVEEDCLLACLKASKGKAEIR